MEQLNTTLLRICAAWLIVIAVILVVGLGYIAAVLTLVHQDVVLPALLSVWHGFLFLLGIGIVLGLFAGLVALINWLFPKVIKAVCLAPFWLWYRVLGMGKKK